LGSGEIREDTVKREDLEALVDIVEILNNPALKAIKKTIVISGRPGKNHHIC
jgi:hypothetical protein